MTNNIQTNQAPYRLSLIVAVLLTLLLTSCTYKDRVAPISLPDSSPNMVLVGNGLKLAAKIFVNEDEAEEVFGFNIRKAGLLPIQLTVQNDSSQPARLMAEETFLVDHANNAWPVASLERTYQRTKKYTEVGDTMTGAAKPSVLLGAAGAVAGLAVGIVTGENIGEAMGTGAAIGAASGVLIGGARAYMETGSQIRQDLADKTLTNKDVIAGQIAYGVLFFPGSDGEAQDARELRLALMLGGEKQIVILQLPETTSPPQP